ncbi:MAG: hypothetical protein ACRYG2_30970, partial [Janthinobacterium lividum]
MPLWSVVLLAATALHAGFQLTVTTLVYPALARLARPDFARAHGAHSRAIVPLVALVYGAVVVASVGAVVEDRTSVLAWSAAVATAVALVVTAVRAAPLHGRLGRLGPEPDLVRELLRADR